LEFASDENPNYEDGVGERKDEKKEKKHFS
jgi:hypothetical protein